MIDNNKKGDMNMEIDERLDRMKTLREKYPKLNLIDRGGRLINLIFEGGVSNEKYEMYFKELEEILEKVK